MGSNKRMDSSTRRVDELLAFDFAAIQGTSEPQIPAVQPSLWSEEPSTAVPIVAGFDEAGRGAVAGPVVVGCVAFDMKALRSCASCRDTLADVYDSKRLAPAKRERAFEGIKQHAAWAVGCASSVEIDCLGIVAACQIAARRAYTRLGRSADLGLFDRGLALPGDGASRPARIVSLTRGDARSLHIAAASIVAKVSRDRLLCRLDERFPQYGLAKHKGYGTSTHRNAVREHGVSRVHRRSFVRSWMPSTENTAHYQFR